MKEHKLQAMVGVGKSKDTCTSARHAKYPPHEGNCYTRYHTTMKY
jgi:hypothetical protein